MTFIIKQKHDYAIVTKNTTPGIESVIISYNNSYYTKLNLTGSMIQELLNQYNKSENQECIHHSK